MRVRPHAVVAALLVSGGMLLGSSVQGLAALDASIRAIPAGPRVLPRGAENVRELQAEPAARLQLRQVHCVQRHRSAKLPREL
jgi:hypothetical protein